MKSIATLLLSLFAFPAFAGEAFYCGRAFVEGSYVKIDIETDTMCISSGPWGPDYCNQATEKFQVESYTIASETIGQKEYRYQEFVGVNAANKTTQTVRVYDEASNVTIGTATAHRANLTGVVTLTSSERPDKEAGEGEPLCVRGEDGSF